MAEQERVPLQKMIQQWEQEMPLIAVDSTIQEMLRHLKHGEEERKAQAKRISDLTTMVAEVRARLRHIMAGGQSDVNL